MEQKSEFTVVVAIIGSKIKGVDDMLAVFPTSQYLRGQRDALVNALEAFKQALKLP